MTTENERLIVKAINGAEEVPDPVAADIAREKPRLFADRSNPDQAVPELRDILADAGGLYDRGAIVRLVQTQAGMVAQVMKPDSLILRAHQVCRPFVLKKQKDGSIEEINAPLPPQLAKMYLEWRGEWRLAPLNGIASAPLLDDNGSIGRSEGYDVGSGMWCENVPDLQGLVPARPTENEASAALHQIRETFKTFCFADAITKDENGAEVVDTNLLPGRDESAFLVALLTAVCRPSLHLAPGVLLRAAPMSGAGARKGLLLAASASLLTGASRTLSPPVRPRRSLRNGLRPNLWRVLQHCS